MASESTEHPALDLPPVEAVDRALGLRSEDQGDLPGLHRLNTRQLPLARWGGFSLALAVVPVHNLYVLGRFDLPAFLVLALGVEAYCLFSWAVLLRFFARVKKVHLGTLFAWGDVIPATWVVLETGGPASLYWPIYFVFVASQIWISRRRAVAMAFTGVAAYVAMDLMVWAGGAASVDWGVEGMKLAVLGGLSLALGMSAGQPWNLRDRTQAARDLILHLEEQSLELERERKRAEDASMAKSEFLARMSHELRTPLNSVLGFTNVLLKNKRLGLGARELDYLQRIRRNAMHLLALINDILDLARIEEGELVIQWGEVDVRALVRETVAQVEDRALGTEIELRVGLPGTLTPVRADEARLRQVLLNLVGNAFKFTERGSVTVEVVTAPGSNRPRAVHVRDTGIGIPPERLEDLFGAFEQVDGGTDRRRPGTGLGLAISHSLCELMGFRLTVESEPGRGSTFTVHLDGEDVRERRASEGSGGVKQKG